MMQAMQEGRCEGIAGANRVGNFDRVTRKRVKLAFPEDHAPFAATSDTNGVYAAGSRPVAAELS